jgi:hypothetical protein
MASIIRHYAIPEALFLRLLFKGLHCTQVSIFYIISTINFVTELSLRCFAAYVIAAASLLHILQLRETYSTH